MGSAAIRGKKVVVESQDFETVISSVEGEVTVEGDGGGGTSKVVNKQSSANFLANDQRLLFSPLLTINVK